MSALGKRAPNLDPDHVPSPCNGVCAIDRGTGLCRGCKRTLDEIRAWGSLPDAAKLSLLAALDAR
jgi:predicted Fe-S protein YdhL (DUF1289 family)